MALTNTQFAQLQTIAEADTKMTDKIMDVAEKNCQLPTIIQRWTKLYTNQNYCVQILKIELDELYGELFKEYKFESNYDWGNTTKGIDSQIYADKRYTTKLRELAAQKYYLDYISETLGTLKQMHYTIKNFLDYKKITTTNI